ncbi:hypothetical protein TrST_g1726 [Triparma strigata]|nr:hypothetical protein TrST_g1726 [Triparma strigata]
MKSKSTKNAVVGSGKLMDMWGVGKPSKENNKEEEKQLKEGKEEEVKAKKSRRVTLTPGGEGGGKRVKKEKKVKEDEQVDEECAKAQAQAQADAAAAKAEKEKKEKRELAVKEENVKEERDEEDVEDEDAEDEVEDEAEHEKEEHEEDEKILTLIKSYPPNLTYTTLATKLMRQSVPMYACGHYWSHYKTLHSLTSKSLDPTPAELAMAKIEKLKAQNKETLESSQKISSYEQARLDRIARNSAYLKSIGLDSSIIPKKSSSNLTRKKKPTVKEKTLTKGGRSSSRIKGIKAVDYATSNVIGASSAVVFEEEEVDENHIVFNDDNIEKYELSSETPKPSNDEGKANNNNKIDDWWFFKEECGGVPSLASVRKPGHFPKDAKTSVLLPSVNLKRVYTLGFERERKVIVGGGHGGYVDVWGLEEGGGEGEGKESKDGWSWRASNNWLSAAHFLPLKSLPLHLLTTANDGILRLWNLNKLQNSQPVELFKAPNIHNKSGIFSMDVERSSSTSPSAFRIATGSKDKSVAVTSVTGTTKVSVTWRGTYHTKTVKSVSFSRKNRTIIGAASDDGTVSISDFRTPEGQSKPSIELADAHDKPHSVVFADGSLPDHVFMTAGSCSDTIKLWDLRSSKEPTTCLRGHTFASGCGKRQIHHPHFYSPVVGGRTYVISGGDRTGGLSLFDVGGGNEGVKGGEITAVNRGIVGEDAGAICVEKDDEGYGFRVAASAGGEVHLLNPKWKK